MAKLGSHYLKDGNKSKFYSKSHVDYVYDTEGNTLGDLVKYINKQLDVLSSNTIPEDISQLNNDTNFVSRNEVVSLINTQLVKIKDGESLDEKLENILNLIGDANPELLANLQKQIKDNADAITKINNEKLDANGNTANNIVEFISPDSGPDSAPIYVEPSQLKSGETHASIFYKVSLLIQNTRWFKNIIGNTNISNISDGTITGSIDEIWALIKSGNIVTNGGNNSSSDGSSSGGTYVEETISNNDLQAAANYIYEQVLKGA
jgi:hypothetical protein